MVSSNNNYTSKYLIYNNSQSLMYAKLKVIEINYACNWNSRDNIIWAYGSRWWRLITFIHIFFKYWKPAGCFVTVIKDESLYVYVYIGVCYVCYFHWADGIKIVFIPTLDWNNTGFVSGKFYASEIFTHGRANLGYMWKKYKNLLNPGLLQTFSCEYSIVKRASYYIIFTWPH